MTKDSTVARGYGQAHKRERQRLQAIIDAHGMDCAYCGRPVDPKTWVLAHRHNLRDRCLVNDGSPWLGPSCRKCNLQASVALTNRRRKVKLEAGLPPFVGADGSRHSRRWAMTDDVESSSTEGRRRLERANHNR
jgi:5-methylcytosine-specific restriction endonuclease McrA